MLTIPHAIVGVAIVSQVPSAIVSLPLAFMSHFVLDMVPHWNPHLNTEIKKYGKVTKLSKFIIYADSTIAVTITLLLSLFLSERGLISPFLVFAGAFMGVMPDLMEFPYFFLGARDKISKTLLKFQKSIQTDVSPLPGILTQIALVLFSLIWIIRGI